MQELHSGDFEGASERGPSQLENNPQFEYSIRHKTVHNSDIFRLNAAISDYKESLKETIMNHQAGDGKNFIEALKLRTKSHFYVKELKEQNPDFEKTYNSEDESVETGQQVLSYIEFYKNNQRLNEDQNTNKELQKIALEKKYVVPQKHKVKLELIKKLHDQFISQQQLIEKMQKQKALQATKDNKPKNQKPKLPKLKLSNLAQALNPATAKTPNNKDLSTVDEDFKLAKQITMLFSAKRSSSKEMVSRIDKLLPKKPKFDIDQSMESRNAQILSMNIKKPFYQNDKKLKDTIKIGEKVFKREFKQDAKREGYSKLLKKITEADLTLRQIKNGQTLFDKDLMTVKYSNPYLQNDQMRQTLINYIESQKPVIVGDPNLNIFDESVMQSQASPEIASTQWYRNSPDKCQKQQEINSDSKQESRQLLTPFSDRISRKSVFKHKTDEKLDITSKIEQFYSTRMGSVPVRVENIQHPFKMTQRNISQPFSKKLEFPASPSFVNNYFLHKNIKVPKMTEVLAAKNVPFTFEEKSFYKIKQQKHRFNEYAHSINTCFETGKPSEFDVGVKMLKGTSNLPAQFVNSHYTDMQLYMPAAADHTKTAKLQAILRKNVKNAKSLSDDLPTGSVINELVGVKPFQKVNQETIRSVFKESEKNKHTILQELHRKLKTPLIVDTKPIDQRSSQLQAIQVQNKSKTSPRRSKDPIQKIFKVNNHAFHFSQLMNQKILKILDRYELDKPIMMQDKLDMIWDKPEGKAAKSLLTSTAVFANTATHTTNIFSTFENSLTQSSESLTKSSQDNADFQRVRFNLKTRKIERLALNRIQIKAYEKLMKFLVSQKAKEFKPQDLANPIYIRPEEAIREFMDAFRIIIQSGYFIQEQDYIELMQILKVTDQAQTREQRVKIFTFFAFAASQLSFNSQKVKDILGETWIEQDD